MNELSYEKRKFDKRRDYKESGDKRREDQEIEKIISEIEKFTNLSEMPTKDFAKEGGYADILANKWRNSLKTSQLRKFFAAMKGIEKNIDYGEKWGNIESQFHLLLPQLAYARGRIVGGAPLIPEGFLDIMKSCMKKVDVGEDEELKVKNYKTFVKFIESIVAYHKYYNPRA